MPEFYNQSNVFFLDEISRWSFIIKNSKQNDIALKIDTALHDIEKNNKAINCGIERNRISRVVTYQPRPS
jgi:type I restriction enzyme M protein